SRRLSNDPHSGALPQPSVEAKPFLSVALVSPYMPFPAPPWGSRKGGRVLVVARARPRILRARNRIAPARFATLRARPVTIQARRPTGVGEGQRPSEGENATWGILGGLVGIRTHRQVWMRKCTPWNRTTPCRQLSYGHSDIVSST